MPTSAWIVLAALLVPVAVLSILSLLARRPTNLGVAGGKLAPCPGTPNCVCTHTDQAECRMEPISFAGSPADALERIHAILTAFPRTKVVNRTDQYLHAECTSRIFRFVDDLEFLVDADNKLIHFRSAARSGRSDFGVNRARMEDIRKLI